MKLYKKIDLFFEGSYLCSTQQSKTCKEAVRKYIETLEQRKHSFAGLTLLQEHVLKNKNDLKAYFDRGNK
jgi:hypothetical protein